jgi:DNA mismatch repair ATPase MutL
MPEKTVPKTFSFQMEHPLSNASGCTQQSPIMNAILPPTNARKPAKTTTTTSRHKPPEQCKAQAQPRNRRERKNNNKKNNNNNKTKQREKNNNRDKKNKQNDRTLTNNNNPSEQSKPHQTEDENNSTTVDQPNPQTPRAAVTNASVLPPMATDRSAKNENIKIITQNVQGLRSEEKLEYIIRLMKQKKFKLTSYRKHIWPETTLQNYQKIFF